MIYKFSVGRVDVLSDGGLIQSLEPATTVEVRWDLSTYREIGPNGEVLDEYRDEETTTIEVTYASGSIPVTLMKGDYYDLRFLTGAGGRGISATLNSCRLTGFHLSSAQGEYATVTLTFSKKGDIDSGQGEETPRQTVTFTKVGGGVVTLGDHAYVSPSYKGNTNPIIIPTALGVLVQSTSDLGGGQLDITLSCHVKKDTRLDLEKYLLNLYSLMSTEKGTLTVNYGGSSYTITDCYWTEGKIQGGKKAHEEFTLEFVKSAY